MLDAEIQMGSAAQEQERTQETHRHKAEQEPEQTCNFQKLSTHNAHKAGRCAGLRRKARRGNNSLHTHFSAFPSCVLISEKKTSSRFFAAGARLSGGKPAWARKAESSRPLA